MKKPMSEKESGMIQAIETLFPGTKKAIDENRCPVCGETIGKFRNLISVREYEISGLCQECQDIAFGED